MLKGGLLQVKTKLPDLSGYDTADFFMGFELGGGTDHGIATFNWEQNDGMVCKIAGKSASNGVEVTDLLPADVKTEWHMYSVKVNAGFAEFYVGKGAPRNLVAIGIPWNGPVTKLYQNTEPYSIILNPARYPTTMPAFLELHGDYEKVTASTKVSNFRWSSEPLSPPRSFRFYDEGADTFLTEGTYDTGTSYKSHPVPVAGYGDRTLLFRADTDSVANGLQIEVYTQSGNWRIYDSITTSANELESYIITGDFPLVRIGYEPSADGASITDAEVHLR